MAAWDEDGTHVDPITGMEVKHQKGELKLNENGTYYYEDLDGRSVYGKRILNKFNTLTTDGSAWNKYDFFDSDDIEQKSIGGSIAKNLALVGSMFIPYVGWGVAAASVAHQSAGLFATLGKMLAGADNPTLNNIEGWVKSTDRRNLKTEYAQQNMWCWENFIDLIGDTTAQLREQRAIFKFVPGILKGDFKALDDVAMKEYTEGLAKKYMQDATNTKFKDIVKMAQKQNPLHWKEQVTNLYKGASDVFTARAEKAARDYITNYYKLGEPIAKAYMTAITVQDTFGEAIEAGASNNEATLLTLGYAAAEAALLSTDLGKWIMPELRADRQRYKMIAKKLLEVPQETREMSKQIARLSGEAKKDWAKRLFNIGKDIATAEYSTMAKTVGSVLASGLGEGIEEVSEELLADFSKSCFNLAQQLQGDDVRMSAWKDMGNRYAMSFVGGIMGGGINAAASDYKVNKELVNMNSQQALQQLVYMTRNNELDDFWKVIDKTTLASKELSTQLNTEGTGYKPGTKDDNQDLEAKRALRKQVSMIESIINAENAKLDDSGLLSMLIQADPKLKDLDPVKEYRMRALSNSATAGRFLNEWNTVVSDITKNRLDQANIVSKYGDTSSEKYSEEDKQELKKKQNELKELQKRKEALINGERTREFVRDALFEMSHAVSEVWDDWCTEIRFAEAKTGKKYSDISEAEKKTLKEQYEQLKGSNQYAEKVHELAEIYETLATSTSQSIQGSMDYLEQIKQGTLKNIQTVDALAKRRLNRLGRLTTFEDGIIDIQKILNDEYLSDMVEFADSQQLSARLQGIENQVNFDIQNVIAGRPEEALTDADNAAIERYKRDGKSQIQLEILNSVFSKIESLVTNIESLGFVHPETRHMLVNMMNNLAGYASMGQDISEATFNDAAAEEFFNKYRILDQKVKKLKELPNTPIVENLRNFQLSTTVDQSVVDLITFLLDKENTDRKDISTFQLDTVTLDQFKQARTFLELYRSAIVGARFDNVDINNIVGFNTTLNEIAGTDSGIKLAEIDAQTADLILEDIDKLLMRIDYSEGLHKLNTGNKFNVQAKTGLNKQFILHNKIRRFVSILDYDDKDEDKWKESPGFAELRAALAKATVLNGNAGSGNYSTRNFALTPEEKAEALKESIEIQTALHKFLSANIDGSEASIKKLAKILKYDNFKGLIRPNKDFLDQTSEDIDDSAFIWWMAATAALDPTQFYNNYRQIIGEEVEGERPLAPIPTQELGVYALTAAVVNGDMFRHFGKALRQSLLGTWNSNPSVRNDIREAYEGYLLDDEFEAYFKNNDFLPNFDNILFIEGIAGSGKSTGTLKMWSRLMAKVNPDFINQSVIFAHTDKTKAEGLAKSTAFANYEVHDHDSLLSYMSPQYTHQEAVNGRVNYVLNRDVKLNDDGILRANWEVRAINPNEVPKIMVIDEWSHYNQLEQELIQRFAQTYGVTVISMGDFDQLTPAAAILKNEGDEKVMFDMTPHRNMTPRMVKYGVSMRTDNEVKNGNMYRMLAWSQNPTRQVDLHYYEDETGIYGDKNYTVGSSYTPEQLEAIKRDVKKMLRTLKPDEKIGYIYNAKQAETSALYKWLTTDVEVKDRIQPYLEKDAHGREAQYYIVENNRSSDQHAEDYFHSVYTGITRSERGSIVITGMDSVHKTGSSNKYDKTGIQFNTVQDSEMLSNTFTDEGTRLFSRNYRASLDRIFGNTEVTPFEIKERTRESVTMNPISEIDSPVTIDDPVIETPVEPEASPEPESPTPTPAPTPSATPDSSEEAVEESSEEVPPPPPPPVEPEPIEEIPPERESELPPIPEESSIGPLPLHQLIYTPGGIAKYVIMGESDDKTKYLLKDLVTDTYKFVDKEAVHNNSFFRLPAEDKLFNVGDMTIGSGRYEKISRVTLDGDRHNPTWVYELTSTNNSGTTNGSKRILSHADLKSALAKGELFPYIGPSFDEAVPAAETVYELGNAADYESAVEEVVSARESEQKPVAIAVENGNIKFRLLGFTFNTQYLADDFDDDGNIVINSRDTDRIDNGYGLYRMNGAMFRNKERIRDGLGMIRRQLEFSDNQDILTTVQRLTRQKGLTMRWAFVSKGSESNKDRYSRLNKSKGTLEYMFNEGTDVKHKTLSAIFYDGSGQAVLEIPMITLHSPHNILRELFEKGIAKDITRLWNFNEKSYKETQDRLTKIVQYIESNYPNHDAYQNIANVIRLWLYSSNGVKVLPEGWNLAEKCPNLGNFYVVERKSDDIATHYFHGQWIPLQDITRKDRFISSIFMNLTETYEDPSTGKTINTVGKGTPYVFISDDPKINDDVTAAKQFIKQQLDPNLPKTVKAYPVSPPEVSVTEYIKAKYNFAQSLRTDRLAKDRYGNKYTAFRIWEAILASPEAEAILSPLSDKEKAFVREYVNKLQEVVRNTPRRTNESNVEYKVRLAKAQNEVLKVAVNVDGESVFVYDKFRNILLKCAFPQTYNDVDISNETLARIQKACDEHGITGVMCHPFLVNDQRGHAVGGFAYKVVVEDKYKFPGQGSFRIFGKIDTPTYDISAILPDIDSWTKDAYLAPVTTRHADGTTTTHNNIWRFRNDDADVWYLAHEGGPLIDLTSTIKYRYELFGRLGIPEYTIDISMYDQCSTEADAMEVAEAEAREQFIKQPGAFAIKHGNKYRYGNILTNVTPEFSNYYFRSAMPTSTGFILEFMDASDNTVKTVEISLDQRTNSFQVTPQSKPNNNRITSNVAKLKQEIWDNFNSSPMKDNPARVALLEQLLVFYDEESNTVDIDSVEAILAEQSLTRFVMASIRKTLKIDDIRNDQNLDECINPIKIMFK